MHAKENLRVFKIQRNYKKSFGNENWAKKIEEKEGSVSILSEKKTEEDFFCYLLSLELNETILQEKKGKTRIWERGKKENKVEPFKTEKKFLWNLKCEKKI